MLLFQATPMASFLDVEILISSLDKLFTFSITEYTQSKASRNKQHTITQRDHAIILIAHFYPNSSFLEVTFLHQDSFSTLFMSERVKEFTDISKQKI